MRILVLFAILLFSYTGLATPVNIKGTGLLDRQPIAFQPEQAKQGVVVVFLSAKCPCSHSHLGELNQLAADFKDYKFFAVHSNSDESEELARKYFSEAHLSFPVIQDEHYQLADQFKASRTPHAFVVDAQGKVRYRGGVSNSSDFPSASRRYLREALSDLHAGKAVRTPEGRTLGCFISRAESGS
jgi:peroxiredoxin